jgi:hypothetical protein
VLSDEVQMQEVQEAMRFERERPYVLVQHVDAYKTFPEAIYAQSRHATAEEALARLHERDSDHQRYGVVEINENTGVIGRVVETRDERLTAFVHECVEAESLERARIRANADAYGFTDEHSEWRVEISDALAKDLEAYDDSSGENGVLVHIWTQFEFWREQMEREQIATDVPFTCLVADLPRAVQVSVLNHYIDGPYLRIEYQVHYEVELQTVDDDGNHDPQYFIDGSFTHSDAVELATALNAVFSRFPESCGNVAEVYVVYDSGEFESVPF